MYWISSALLVLLARPSSAQAMRVEPTRRQAGYPYGFGNETTLLTPESTSTPHGVLTSVTITYDLVPDSSSTPAATASSGLDLLSTTTTVSAYVTVSRSEVAESFATPATTSRSASPSNYAPPPIEPVSASTYTTSLNGLSTGGTAGPSASYAPSGSPIFSYAPTKTAPQSSLSTGYSESDDNATCGGATLNVLQASLDWWHSETYTYAASTISLLFDYNDTQTGWTLLPATTTFDISSAVAEPFCIPTASWNTAINATWTDYDCFTTPTPVAASTTLVTIDGVKTTDITTGNGTSFPNIAVTPPPATATISNAPGVISSGTNFVYFSAYEIMSKKPTVYNNGSSGCHTSTQTHNMTKPFSFRYFGRNLSGFEQSEEGINGDIDSAFLEAAGVTSSVELGTFEAKPTVIMVVKRAVIAQAVLAAHTEVSESYLDVPTPTLPGFLTPVSTPNTRHPWQAFTAHLEISAETLDVPTPAHGVSTTDMGGAHVTTVAVGGAGGDQGNRPGAHTNNGGSGDDEATVGAAIVTGSSSGGGNGQSGNDGGYAGVLAGIVTAIIGGNKPTQPTNAAEVLHNALNPTHSNPTASAIVAGLGGNTGGQGSGSSGSGGNGNGGSSGGNSGNGGSAGSGQDAGSSGSSGGQDSGGSQGGSGGSGGGSSSGSSGSNGQGAGSGSDSGSGSGGSGSGFNAGSGYGSHQDGGSNVGGSSSNGNGGSAGQGAYYGAIGNGAGSQPSPAQVLTYNGATITAKPVPAYVVDGQTAVAGGPAITVHGKVVSVPAGSDALIVDGSVVTLGGNAASPTSFEVDALAFTRNAAPGFVIAGQTLQPGGPAVTVDGKQLSLAPGAAALVVDGSTSTIANYAAATRIPLITLGSQTITANAATQYHLANDQTLVPGSSAVVGGTTISLAQGATAIVVNGVTQTLAAPTITPPPGVTFAGTVYEPNAGSMYCIDGQTLTPGGVITVSGTTISLAAGATAVALNGQTQTLDGSTNAANANAITIANTVYTPTHSIYTIAGQTLTPGGQITISGTTLSLAPSGTLILINGTPLPPQPTLTAPPLLTLANTIYPPNALGIYTLPPSLLLSPGGPPITFPSPNGLETVSLAPNGRTLFDTFAGKTYTSTFPEPGEAARTLAPVLSIGGEGFTALPENGSGEPSYLIDGRTLAAGEVETVTLGGKTFVISLAGQATMLVIETEGVDGVVEGTGVETLFPASARTAVGTATGTGARGGQTAMTGSSGGAARTGSAGSGGEEEAGLQGGAPSSSALGIAGIVAAVGTLVLAIWL